jgi:hypothetical protein
MTNENQGGYTLDYIPSTKSAYYKRAVKVLSAHRDKKCQRCPSGDKIEAHHIDEDITNNEIDNLEWLCRECHEIHHGLR